MIHINIVFFLRTQGSGSQKIGHIFARDKDNDTNSVIKYYLEDGKFYRRLFRLRDTLN